MIEILSLIIWAALLFYVIPKKILSTKEKREQQSFEKKLIHKRSVNEDCWHCEWCGNKNPNSSHVCNVCGRGTKNNGR